ncbi:MAG: YggT family protein [Nitrospirota bacterium]|nr:YggT family protein [Nitrospirota bacterium]
MDFAGSVLGNMLAGIAEVIGMILTLYMWVVIIRSLISWVNPDPYNPIVQFLQRATDPVLYQIRKRLGMGSMGFDFSPIIVILIIIFLQFALVGSLKDLAMRLH